MRNTPYHLISKSFEDYGDTQVSRIELVSPQFTIWANRLRTKNKPVFLSEVWFRVKTEVALTRTQIEAALNLRTEDSNLCEAAKTIYTTTKSTHQEIPFDDFIDRYIAESSTLCSLYDQPPKISINDTIIDSPVEVPSHAWSRYYAAFEAYKKTHPEFGMAWDSVVLFRDGLALRKAQQANFLHALLPQTAKMLEGVDFVNALNEASAIQKLVKSDEDVRKMTSLNDIYQIISKTPEPFIPPAEINRMGEFASELLGKNICELEYSTSPKTLY